jgi:hypothetical protein
MSLSLASDRRFHRLRLLRPLPVVETIRLRPLRLWVEAQVRTGKFFPPFSYLISCTQTIYFGFGIRSHYPNGCAIWPC